MKTLLKNCTILAPSQEGFTPIKNGFLGIDKDAIDYVGDTRPQGQYDLEKDLLGALLLPGLINCHGHTGMTLLRGIGSDLPLDEWLFQKMMPVEERMTAEDIKAGSALSMLEMLACGTTSFSDMYMEPQVTAELAIQAGMKANLCRPVQCFDESERPEESFRIKESLALYDEYHMAADGRIRIDFSIHGEYTNYPHIVAAYAGLCRVRGGRMHIHLSETVKEHEGCKARYGGKTPARWFYELGVFESPTSAAHCVAVEREDMDILYEKDVSVIHNPTSNLKLGSGFAPVPKMLKRGINVTLGTDGAASNNNLNMFEEMHLASIIHNGFLQEPTIMNPVEVLKMATRNGALLQGRENTGTLSVGAKADILAISLDGPHMLPAFDLPALLCYSAQGSDVVMTMVDGKILYEKGEYLTLDADRIRHDVKKALRRLYG